MKTIIVADIHLKNKDPFGQQIDSNGIRVENRSVNKVKKIKEIVEKEAPELFVIAGDLFDTYSPPEWLRAVFFSMVSKLQCKIIYVAGNHDVGHKFPAGVSESYGLANFLVVPARDTFSFGDYTFLGWTPDKEEAIQLLNYHSSKYLIGHGDRLQHKNFEYGFFGHDHKPNHEGKFYSIGSLFKDDWAEESYDNYYVVINDGISFVKNNDIRIKTFSSIEEGVDGFDAARFKLKGRAEEINKIDKKAIQAQYSSKVFFSFEIEKQEAMSAGEEKPINEIITAFLGEKNLSENQIAFGKNIYDTV